MDIHQLRYMVALSRELHFQRAARKVHVTQPTLSQGIKNLERELGTTLFERTPHTVRLTASGERFLVHAIAALGHIQKGVFAVQKDTAELQEPVRLGVIPTICPYLMPKVIPRLKKEAPHLAVELYEETTSVLLDFLKNGRLDLGLLALPVKGKGIVEQRLASEPFYLAVSRKHRLASKKKVTRADLTGEKLLILREGHCFGQQVLDFCKIQRKNEQVVFQGSSLESVIRLAAAGEGVTLIPEMAMGSGRDLGLVYLPFGFTPPKRDIGVAWRVSEPLFMGPRSLIEVIRRVLNEEKPK